MSGRPRDIVGRFTRAELREIGARTREYCRANPPTEPVLGEAEPVVRPTVCPEGHPLVARADSWLRCRACRNRRDRERYAEGRG